MKRPSLEDKLVKWLMEQKTWVAKGEITRIPWKGHMGTTYIPETVGRTLRKAEKRKRIAVKPQGKSIQYKWLPYDRRERYIPTAVRPDAHVLFRK